MYTNESKTHFYYSTLPNYIKSYLNGFIHLYIDFLLLYVTQYSLGEIDVIINYLESYFFY